MSMDSTPSTLTLLGPNEVAKTCLPPPLEGIAPHDEFWFPDGSLILVARDVAFRVYRCLLSDQSTVFADMFAAASVDADETFEACPILRLSDSSQDLTQLLHILLPKLRRRRLHPRQDEPKHSFDEVSSLVRLSHKYHIQDIKGQALDLLRERYTDDFDRWRLEMYPGPSRVSIFSIHCIGAVNIARLTDTPSLLPTALYSCCRLGPGLLDGWKREDGHIEHLSTSDLKRCFAARETLCKERAHVISQIFDGEPGKECLNTAECRPALKDIALSLLKSLSPGIGCGALNNWTYIINEFASVGHLCSACKKELRCRDVNARREVWKRLPEIFGISVQGWGEVVGPSDAV